MSRALLVCARGPFREYGLVDRLKGALAESDIKVVEMEDIDSNPKIRSARLGKEICRERGVDGVIALGGGSAMDAGKIIAAAAAMEVDPFELIWGKRLPVTASLPLVTIPTIAATGTEVNNAAVMVDETSRKKYWCLTSFPKVALLDPEVVATVPPALTIWGAMDILSHTFEFYFNDDRESEVQNRLSEAILLSTMGAVERLAEAPGDGWATGELMWNAVLAWGGVTKIGRGEPDMTCHSIEESFSGYFDTHHGACLAVLTPIWMEQAAEKRPAPFARFGRNVMGVSETDESRAAKEAIDRYKKWLNRVNAPQRFADFGSPELFTDERLERVANNVLGIYGGSIGRLVPLTSVEEILAILRRGRRGIE